MKRLNIFFVVLCLLSLQACDRFLDLKPRGTELVRTIENYRDIMSSYMWFVKTPNPEQRPVFGGIFFYPEFSVADKLGIYTGETTLDPTESHYFDKNKGEYTVAGKNLLNWLYTDHTIWSRYYSFLGPLNLVISGIETAEGTNENLRNYVQGEALAWRAFAYFKLLQYYAPYKDNTYGVPVFLESYEDVANAMPPRNTQREVYAQILDDCHSVLKLLEKTNSADWNCAYRYDFINAMMASIYTYKAMSGAADPDDWQNAEKCADEAMLGRTLTNSSAVLKQMFDCSETAVQIEMSHDEFYFRLVDGNNGQLCNLRTAYSNGELIDGTVNPEYYKLFADDHDIRKPVYFNESGTRSDKYNLYSLSGYGAGGVIIPFRLAEMFLIKAEALARQGKNGDAMTALQNFQKARYAVTPALPSSPDKLLKEILDERTREFYMENDFRWLDMKRLGVSVKRLVSGETYTLHPDDFRYCFPVPRSEMETNHNMVQTPGWERVML